ncbi:DEAD/DEAH box helicase [Candidatus Saccharibacteria bacterium]|nr:DEAD/DEAH box helicase [Candidatus Saccharibacteria bacterium]
MAKRRFNAPRNVKGIHPSKFINKAIEPEADIPYVPVHSFQDFDLSKQIISNLDYLKYEKPSEIQDKCIPLSLEGKDIIGLANTGTGKTAAFLLPIINKLSRSRDMVSVLILAPTRELAQQIDQEFRNFSAGQKLYSTLVVGGANIGRQIQQIKRGPHVIIGTPGRIKDLIGRRVLRLSNVNTFVLDEADRMCDMGFERDIRSIASEIPRDRQTLCYSATMTDSVKKIVEEFSNNPITISVVKSATNDHIEQDVVHVNDKEHKVETLLEMLSQPEFEKVIVFGETKFGVQRLADRLTKSGIPAEAIHGNKSQSQRERALRNFKNNLVNILVATDVAARGLDIPNVSHVINFDPPKVYDDYVHRIGRTGRAGKTGKALTFVQPRDRN